MLYWYHLSSSFLGHEQTFAIWILVTYPKYITRKYAIYLSFTHSQL